MAKGPYLTALTGTIGSGKSSLARFLADQGAIVIDADDLAREAVAPGSRGLAGLRKLFGDSILLPDGSLDRKRVADFIFDDASLRKQVEQIIHPEVFRLFDERVSTLNDDAIVVYVVPLLFESGRNLSPFKKIIVISAGEKDAVARVAQRDQAAPEAVKKRMSAQLPSCEKEKRADIIIRNDGTIEDLRARSVELFRELSSWQKKAST